jgi:PEGA domain
MAAALGRGGPYAAQGVGIMSRVIAVIACGFTLAACSTTMPSLDFMKSAPQSEMLAIESEPPGAEAKTSLGQSCRTPCQLAVQPGSEFSVTLALSGYQLQTVSVRQEVQGAGAAIRTQSGSRHPAGGDASEEAGCEEKEAGCGSGPSGSIAAGGLGNPNSSAGACSKGCAYSYPGALRLGGGGAIRHQLSMAVAIIEGRAE